MSDYKPGDKAQCGYFVECDGHAENARLRGALEAAHAERDMHWKATVERLRAELESWKARNVNQEINALEWDARNARAEVEKLKAELEAEYELSPKWRALQAERDRATAELRATEEMRGREIQEAHNNGARNAITLTGEIRTVQAERDALKAELDEIAERFDVDLPASEIPNAINEMRHVEDERDQARTELRSLKSELLCLYPADMNGDTGIVEGIKAVLLAARSETRREVLAEVMTAVSNRLCGEPDCNDCLCPAVQAAEEIRALAAPATKEEP